MVQLSHTYVTTGENITLTNWTFAGKVMSLLFNMLSRFVTAFLPRSKHLLISWLQSLSTVILEHKKIRSITASTFPPAICLEPDTMTLIFWILSFKLASLLSSFTLIKRLFSSSSLSAIRMVLSAYRTFWIFLLVILIPAYELSSSAFCIMSSAYKLDKQGDNIQPWRTPLPILNQSVFPCPVLTVDSWPAYRFLRSQVIWSGIPVSLSIFCSLFWSTLSEALA